MESNGAEIWYRKTEKVTTTAATEEEREGSFCNCFISRRSCRRIYLYLSWIYDEWKRCHHLIFYYKFMWGWRRRIDNTWCVAKKRRRGRGQDEKIAHQLTLSPNVILQQQSYYFLNLSQYFKIFWVSKIIQQQWTINLAGKFNYNLNLFLLI